MGHASGGSGGGGGGGGGGSSFATLLSKSFVAEQDTDNPAITGGGAAAIRFNPDTFYSLTDTAPLGGFPSGTGLEIVGDDILTKAFQATEDGLWRIEGGFLAQADATGKISGGWFNSDDVGSMFQSRQVPLDAYLQAQGIAFDATLAVVADQLIYMNTLWADLTADPYTPGIYSVFRFIRLA